MALSHDIGVPCIDCPKNCKDLRVDDWRPFCSLCKCSYKKHDIFDKLDEPITTQLGLDDVSLVKAYCNAQKIAHNNDLVWLPAGATKQNFSEIVDIIPENYNPQNKNYDQERRRIFRKQIPVQDRKPHEHIVSANRSLDNLENETKIAHSFFKSRNKRDLGIGFVTKFHTNEPKNKVLCCNCKKGIELGELHIEIRSDHQTIDNIGDGFPSKKNKIIPSWHFQCFSCTVCGEILVDFIYAWSNGKPYCLNHYSQLIRPRCFTCDHLIFSDQYTRIMEQEHHNGHFACKSCDVSLTGQRYILRDEEPHCLNCYESKFANTCDQCKQKIGCDSKDLSFKDRHWHEKCFKCNSCETNLADRPFATNDEDLLFCSDCHDEKYAPRCDSCQNVFKAGQRKYEYKGQQWHEDCFICFECKQPIGAKSFIPRDNQVVCVPCYESKYAQRCTKCSDVIRRGGVTYKGNPWHKECFNCTSCGKQLAGLKFTSKDDQPYCAECYGELFAKKCTNCTKPITGFGGCKFISFEERHWHSECFACSKCQVNLVGSGFLTSEDQSILCGECGR